MRFTPLTIGVFLAALPVSAVLAQTAPPTAEELQRDNQQITQTEAAKVHGQNAQMQQQLDADKAQRDRNFTPNPYVPPGANPYGGTYVPPPPPPAPRPH